MFQHDTKEEKKFAASKRSDLQIDVQNREVFVVKILIVVFPKLILIIEIMEEFLNEA